jgi:hypothetical protein
MLREREIVEAEALELLSTGFEWCYEEPLLLFVLPDGGRIAFDRGWGPGRWYRLEGDRSILLDP